MKSINVALIDDSSIYRELLKMILRSVPDYKFNILFEAETLVGIEDNKQYHEELDVILLDIMMPDIDGVTGIPILQDLFPTSSIIMVSDVESPKVKEECIEKGAMSYIIKSAVQTRLAPEIIAYCNN
ncbi:response regulator [Sphingobacterium hotanense]|uniref:Response regulator transcription factor n=1 Tax=Sphingobacterium hotanense TaxID=649196 RepID=A0ABT7NT65_9SPHI|nr:response regulator transcription factor [Sphingobacterium hotanense]MDM1050402.1 response regulator transcription factor [Sphingobacterium hotanense]